MARIGGVILIALAGWLLFVPVSAVYTVTKEDRTPRNVSTLYSWWTNDQELVYTESGLPPRPPEQTPLVFGFRISCGTVFSAGAGEAAEAPLGPQVCADVERPRWIGGSILLLLGVAAFVLAQRLPAQGGEPTRYREPWAQRRARRRSR